MRPIRVTLTPDVLDRNGISLSQTPAAGGAQNLTITGALATGGVATFSIGTLVAIYGVADESGKTFTVTGTDFRGITISEVITGPTAGATVTGSSYFKTVTQITVSADTTGAVEAGVTGASASDWYILDEASRSPEVGISVEITDTATITVQLTTDDLQTTGDLNAKKAFNHADSTLVGATASVIGNYFVPAGATRVIITAYTSGNIVFNLLQAG